MTTQATAGVQRQGRPGVRAQLAMTAISLAVLGGLVLWQVRQGGEETTTPIASSATQNTETECATPLGGLAERYREEQRERAVREAEGVPPRGGLSELYAAQAAAARPTVYVVESEARSQALRVAIEQVNAAMGEPPLRAEVVWVDSPEAEASFWATQQAQRMRDGGRGAALSVIDLRPTLPAASSPAVGACGLDPEQMNC